MVGAHRLVHVMGGLHYGDAVAADLAQCVGDLLLCGRIQPGGGFVEQQQRRFLGECLSDQGSLALAAGQGVEASGRGSVMSSRSMQARTVLRSCRDSHRHGPRCAQRPMATVSRTVSGSVAGTAVCWTTNAGRSVDRRHTVPARGVMTPAMTPSSVDFPDPLGPTTAVTRPHGMAVVRLCRTGLPE